MNKIILSWKKDNEAYTKELEKRCLMDTFKGLVEGFGNNNEISKKLLKVIPEADDLYINWDCTADVNRVYYSINGKIASIPIINAHSVVWAVLNKYCQQDENEVD